MLFEILQNITRKVFEKANTEIDNYLIGKRERGELKNTDKREKYFLPRFGDILYARTRYKDKRRVKLTTANYKFIQYHINIFY